MIQNLGFQLRVGDVVPKIIFIVDYSPKKKVEWSQNINEKLLITSGVQICFCWNIMVCMYLSIEIKRINIHYTYNINSMKVGEYIPHETAYEFTL